MGDWSEIKNKIVLEGEAGYKKSLSSINQALREAQSEMKAVSAEYEQNGSGAEALRAQIEALENVHEGQQLRLETMRQHLEKVTREYGENSQEASRLRTEINKAREAMAKTGTQLTELRTRLDAASDAGEDMGGAMNGATDGLVAVGEQASRAQSEVEELSSSIAEAMGRKMIEFEIGKRALDGLGNAVKEAVKWSIDEALQGQSEDAMTRALAGDDALSERRTGIKDAVDRTWAGRRDGATTVGDVAAVDTALGNMGITDEDRVKHITDLVITHNEVFGQSTQDTIDRAKALINTFGISWDEALDLMTKGMQDMDDGGAIMLSAFETYPQVFRQIGYSAEAMYGAIKKAANDEALGKDNNLAKALRTSSPSSPATARRSKARSRSWESKRRTFPPSSRRAGRLRRRQRSSCSSASKPSTTRPSATIWARRSLATSCGQTQTAESSTLSSVVTGRLSMQPGRLRTRWNPCWTRGKPSMAAHRNGFRS